MLRSVLVASLSLLVLALVLALGVPTGAQADDGDAGEAAATTATGTYPKFKTATNLQFDDDGDLTSQVTLGLPRQGGDDLTSDVVLVLDISDCSDGTMAKLLQLAEDFESAQDAAGAHINIGVVVFKGSAWQLFQSDADAVNGMLPADKAVTKLQEIQSTFAPFGGLDKLFSSVGQAFSNPVVALQALNWLQTNEPGLMQSLQSGATGSDSSSFIPVGSNLDAGLRAADDLLQKDATTPNSRKYVVTITDGLVYYWNDDSGNGVTGPVYGVYSEDPNLTNDEHNYITSNIDVWREATVTDAANGTRVQYTMPEGLRNWSTYEAQVRQLIAQDGDSYVANWRDVYGLYSSKTNPNSLYSNPSGYLTYYWDNGRFIYKDGSGDDVTTFTNGTGKSYIPKAEVGSYQTTKQHAFGVDRGALAAYDTYGKLVDKGYHCYAYASLSDPYTASGEYGEGTFTYMYVNALNAASSSNVSTGDAMGQDLHAVRDDLLYQVGAGSYVNDYLGYVAGTDGYDFDLESLDSMQIVAEGTYKGLPSGTYAAESIGENTWGFAKPADGETWAWSLDGETQTYDGYAYTVTYVPGDKGEGEHLVWTFNVPVSNFQRIALTYTVRLTNPQQEVGVYGQYDADGSKGYDALYTNRQATLWVVAPGGTADDAVNGGDFPQPTVSYDVVGVTKAWANADGSAAAAPEDTRVSVDVRRTNDNATVHTFELSSANSWNGTVVLEATNRDGSTVYDYAVEEQGATEGYTATVAGSVKDGFVVTNTKTPEPTPTPTPTPKPGKTTTTVTRILPNTGDPTSIVGALAGLLGGSGALVAAAGLRRRKR